VYCNSKEIKRKLKETKKKNIYQVLSFAPKEDTASTERKEGNIKLNTHQKQQQTVSKRKLSFSLKIKKEDNI
jgi:hypothetical protein